MRRIGLLIGLIIGSYNIISLAEEEPGDTPPPPPRVMEIHMKDNTIDSILCMQIDPDVGITFDRFQMKVGIIELDASFQPIVHPVTQEPLKSTRFYCTSLIDSITFNLFIPPSVSPTE